MAATIQALGGRHRVAVLSLRGPEEPPTEPALLATCEWIEEVARAQPGPGLAGRMRRRTREGLAGLTGTPAWAVLLRSRAFADRLGEAIESFQPDVVQFENHVMAQYASVPHLAGRARILVLHEPGTAAARDRRRLARGLRGVLRHSDLMAWQRWEPGVLAAMDVVVTFTERDRQSVREIAPRALARTIPLGVPVPAVPLSPLGVEPPSMVFVGNFNHPPNVEAALALADQVLPVVRRQIPVMRAYIVGPHPPAVLASRQEEGVMVTGAVPDVTPFLDRATTVVAPIWSGGGMRVKVLEALAAGKALVATPRAVEGLDLIAGREVLIGSDADTLSHAVLELVRDARRRTAIAGAGRRWAEANMGPEVTVGRYERVWEEALQRRENRTR
jgi:glycosyltransferase involved in cell wall biosynthesis